MSRSVLKSAQRIINYLFFVQISLNLCAQGIQDSILRQIKEKAFYTHSDAVVIKKNGKIIYENFQNQVEKPIYIASAGKSLASLAIGKLLDDKLLDSLDQPIHTIYPQWKQDKKKDVTVRMLLNHTSGIQNHPNASLELEPPPEYKIENIIELALAAELSDIPGTTVSYNNKAVALLGGVVEKLSGKSFDSFFETYFFQPLGIKGYKWIKDKSGNPTVHGAFIIKPSDFIKFGELVLNKGLYNGKRIISEEWINESLKPSQKFTPIWGLLWWRLPEYEKRIVNEEIWESWKNSNVPKEFLDKMESIKGVLYNSKYEFYNALNFVLGDNWNVILNRNLGGDLQSSKRIYATTIKAYYADGYRGNYLVVVPESQIVAVRCADAEGFNYKTDFFPEFVPLVAKLGG